MLQHLELVIEQLIELVVVVVVPVAWETDSESRDVGVAFDTDGTDSERVSHNGHNAAHKLVHNVTDHDIVGVRSVGELLSFKNFRRKKIQKFYNFVIVSKKYRNQG